MLTPLLTHPLAIAMWDFSWVERRWPGAGYEDWGEALDALVARGYDAVRIDPYPHLLASDPGREWELAPCWNQQDWGSPALTRVRLTPDLFHFLAACAERGLRVALSSWFREDRDERRRLIASGETLGRLWRRTLDLIRERGLLDVIWYVDLCNEWPLTEWAPFYPDPPAGESRGWHTPTSLAWMSAATAEVRRAYATMPLTFSVATDLDRWPEVALPMCDLLEPHLWMANHTDFYTRVGYRYQRFEATGYERLARYGEPLYRAQPNQWLTGLRGGIENLAAWSRATRKPLVTTEAWAVVDYKDWPLLSWDWVKEICEVGVTAASAHGRWVALATSNFCGPQFVGMWRDVAWHRRLTDRIHSGALPPEDERRLL